MISTDFAPNEQLDDAWLSLKLIFQPWRWINGPEIDLLKKQFLTQFQISNLKFQISLFLSGRSALYHLIKSFNLPDQSQIIVQAFTCEAVVLPIIEAKARPIYIDIEQETLSMNIEDLRKKISANCRVLILQHTFGLTPKYREEILKLAKEKNLILIEDLAHGFNSTIFKSNNYSLISNNYFLISFGRSKPFSSVFGGAIISLDKKIDFKLIEPAYSQIFNLLLYKPIALLIKLTYNIFIGKAIHKIVNSLSLLSKEISDQEKRGEYDSYFDKAYPNALAILLLHQLNKLNQMQEKRLKIVKYYLKNLEIENCKLKISNNAMLRFPLLVNNRDKIIEKARQHNVFLGLWYNQVVAPKSLDLNKVFYQKGSCPIAENICKKIINLPTLITEKEAKKICTLLKK